MRQQKRVQIAAILGVELHDLELRHHQLGERERHGLEHQPFGEREGMTHLECSDEDVDLTAARVVVEEQPLRAVHRVEGAVRLVALPLQELRNLPAVPFRGGEVDVADLAPEQGVQRLAGVDHDRNPAEDAHRNARPLRCFEESHRLLDDVLVNRDAVRRHADPRRQSSTGSSTRSSSRTPPSSWSIKRSAATRPISYPGMRTVVNGGCTNSAKSKSSKPVTATSLGTRSPCSRTARIAPIASRSFPPMIAVGGYSTSSNLPAIAAPDAGSQNPCATSNASPDPSPARARPP